MRLKLAQVTYSGPAIDDLEVLGRLDLAHRQLLERVNGFIAFGGGLHIRGACLSPAWHSLRYSWDGPGALSRLFPELMPTDVPLGQDAVGDQFVLRHSLVHRLSGETGELESLGLRLAEFLEAACVNPSEFLMTAPLKQFHEGGGELRPGELLSIVPPFVVSTATDRRSVRAVPAEDRLRYLADLAGQIGHLPDGTNVQFKFEP